VKEDYGKISKEADELDFCFTDDGNHLFPDRYGSGKDPDDRHYS
jgi:hypothetical protein